MTTTKPANTPTSGPLTRLPRSGLIGIAASAIAITLWTIEQLSGLLFFELLTIPFKVALLAATFLFLPHLSARLHQQPRLAFKLYLALMVLTLLAIIAYLPWRPAFTAHFGNGAYRWYHAGSTVPEFLNADFAAWQTGWTQHLPHKLELGLLLFCYGFLLTACTLWRLRKVSGAIVAALFYAILLLAPIFTGLILWDYDVFLKGIIFDSISFDLVPFSFWFAGDHSIFLYVFLFIFFGTTARFTYRPSPLAPNGANASSRG